MRRISLLSPGARPRARFPFRYWLLRTFWPASRLVNAAARLPLIGRVFARLYDAWDVSSTILPVNVSLPEAEDQCLPYPIVEALVKSAEHRVIMNECVCRYDGDCARFPSDLGCLFLGPGSRDIDPRLGAPATVGESMAHAEQAMRLGLVPTIVHSSFDAWMVGIREYRQMLVVCFCCECCCTVHDTIRKAPPSFLQRVHRLPGLTVSVGESCVGCGACAEGCPARAIVMQGGRATVGADCKGCGRCAAVCPSGAIALNLEKPVDAVVAELMDKVSDRTTIGAPRG